MCSLFPLSPRRQALQSQPAPQFLDLQVTITAVSSATNTFTLHSGGTTKTIHVNSSTTYGGAAQKLADLQVGWFADVRGVRIAGTTYVAHYVSASSGGFDT
jgi:hypothetical protein